MKQILLNRLTLDAFKGCPHLELDFHGRSASIYGDNAAGKTTIYDALTWLLFGKDSRGRSSFEIKPLNADGQVADHGAVTSVEAVLLVDGTPITLKKTLFERWSAKRGSAQQTYDGNTSEYFVDDVPVKKYEYERRVGELVSEDLFRILTNVTWFCEGMDWKARRDVLFSVCGTASDAVLMAQSEEFKPLADALNGLSLDDFKKKLLAQRKSLNGARNTIPARLDEQKQSIAALSGLDFDSLRRQREDVSARLEQQKNQRMQLEHGALLDAKRNEWSSLRNQLDALVNKNQQYRQSQQVPVQDPRPALRQALERTEQERRRWAGLADNEAALIETLEQDIEHCREAWRAENAMTFTAGPCPTCGQALPETLQERARVKFQAERTQRKQEITQRAERSTQQRDAAQERRTQYLTSAVSAEEEKRRLQVELNAYQPQQVPEVHDLPDFAAKQEHLQAQMQAVQAEVDALEQQDAAERANLNETIFRLQTEVAQLDGELAKESLLEFARQREEELRQEARKTAETLERIDRQLLLCDEFARYKVQCIETRINSRFRLARFRLFAEQVNGGLADCCEVTYDGVPYGSLNNGARINLGVDVIRTVAEYYGLRVPLVVDNAESVVHLLDAGTQVIRLVVSENDKNLRCEYES